MPRGLDDERSPDAGIRRFLRRVDLVGAEFSRAVELRADPVDADHAPVAERRRSQECCHSDAAETDDRDVIAVLRRSRIDHGATARENGAAEYGGDLRRNVCADHDGGAAVDDGVSRESGDAEVM